MQQTNPTPSERKRHHQRRTSNRMLVAARIPIELYNHVMQQLPRYGLTMTELITLGMSSLCAELDATLPPDQSEKGGTEV